MRDPRSADAPTMEQKGLRAGHFAGLLGALAALASLWRPWYTVDFPPQLRDALTSEGAKSGGPLGQLVQGLAAAMPETLSPSGWEALRGADVAVCLGAAAVAALVIAAAGAFGAAVRVDPRAAARGIAAVGTAGVAIAVVHLVHRPLDAELVHPAGGLWLALAGSTLALLGGLSAMQADGPRATAAPATAFPRLEPELPAVFAPAGASAAPRTSVPPPA
ncbi:MAG TPA: hypothetical protein VK501_02105 [Baekduia sp.]|uniref:hypothetical protein n=1 Tax=Baekduia sp. TaxID=2600305 RepID=UPI002BC244BB|nr:hypothetical protein [Baekduia sp.]HMJ32682.1 hypothetical protein [Baekduia sp.]